MHDQRHIDPLTSSTPLAASNSTPPPPPPLSLSLPNHVPVSALQHSVASGSDSNSADDASSAAAKSSSDASSSVVLYSGGEFKWHKFVTATSWLQSVATSVCVPALVTLENAAVPEVFLIFLLFLETLIYFDLIKGSTVYSGEFHCCRIDIDDGVVADFHSPTGARVAPVGRQTAHRTGALLADRHRSLEALSDRRSVDVDL